MYIPVKIKRHYEQVQELGLTKEEFYIAFLLYQISKGNTDARDVYNDILSKFKKVVEGEFTVDGIELSTLKLPLLPTQADNLIKCKLLFSSDAVKGKFVVNHTLFEEIFADPLDSIEELLSIFRPIKLQTIGTTNTFSAANVDDLKSFTEEYLKAINYSTPEHKEVILDCVYAFNNDLINMGIKKVLANKMWKEWRTLRLQETKVSSKKVVNTL